MTGDEILEQVRFLIKDDNYSRFDEINFAFEELCRVTTFNWLRKSDTNLIKLRANCSEYQLDMQNMRRLERVWIFGVNSSKKYWHYLEETTPQRFEELVRQATNSDGSAETNRPAYFKIESGDENFMKIHVTPTPDQAYDTKFDYIEHIPNISRETQVRIPAAYHRALALLSAGYILEMSSDPIELSRSEKYITRARSLFENMVSDSHPNRVFSLEKQPYPWIK